MSPFQIFSTREPWVPEYQVPAINVLNDDSGGVLVLPPDAPELLYLVENDMKWKAVEGATGYLVEKRTGTLWSTLAQLDANTTRLQSSSLVPTAYYRVRAFNTAGNGLPSNAMLLE